MIGITIRRGMIEPGAMLAQLSRSTMKTVQANISEEMYRRMQVLVKEGWFPDTEEIIKQALRKFLDSHDPKVLERHLQEDLEWGLRGVK
jgi:Arc/MetJ-type ribon-helix-helix transcriptional regulator